MFNNSIDGLNRVLQKLALIREAVIVGDDSLTLERINEAEELVEECQDYMTFNPD